MKLALGKLLKQRGQTQASLADDLDVSRGYMSELVSGKKSPSPALIARMCDILEIGPGELFETPPANLEFHQRTKTNTGFSESAVVPYSGPATAGRQICAMMQAPVRNPTLYVVSKPATAFGLLAGDVLIVDLNYSLNDGDLVLATKIDDSATASTNVYRLATPWLIPNDTTAQPVKLDDTGAIAVVGAVAGSVRGMKT